MDREGRNTQWNLRSVTTSDASPQRPANAHLLICVVLQEELTDAGVAMFRMTQGYTDYFKRRR